MKSHQTIRVFIVVIMLSFVSFVLYSGAIDNTALFYESSSSAMLVNPLNSTEIQNSTVGEAIQSGLDGRGSLEQNTVLLEIDTISVSISHEQVSAGHTVDVSATIRDESGQPLSGELVTFFGSLGTIYPDNAITNSNGVVSAIYTAGTESGNVTIQALAASTNDSAQIKIVEGSEAEPTTSPTPRPSSNPEATVAPSDPDGEAGRNKLYLPVVSDQ